MVSVTRTTMKSRRLAILGWLVAATVFVLLWAFFAPVQLGGSVTYSITDGVSMQPLLYKNDLALVRRASTYHVGDVVLYESQVLDKPVLHRVFFIQNGNYFFKGDNNDFVDPGYATQDELVGKMWFHIPGAGSVLGWFGKPLHAAVLAGFAALVVGLAGVTATPSRRRRGKASSRKQRS